MKAILLLVVACSTILAIQRLPWWATVPIGVAVVVLCVMASVASDNRARNRRRMRRG